MPPRKASNAGIASVKTVTKRKTTTVVTSGDGKAVASTNTASSTSTSIRAQNSRSARGNFLWELVSDKKGIRAVPQNVSTPSSSTESTTVISSSTSVTTTGKKRKRLDEDSGGSESVNQSSSLKVEKTEQSKRKGRGKTSKETREYAPPEKYAHLKGVPDALTEGLVLVLVGLNPGVTTAEVGHCYSSPNNRFWRFLHSSGLTPDRIVPSLEDQTLPAKYSLGHTNLVARPTLNQSELSKEEMEAGVVILEEKMRKWKPEAACMVGKGIWESIYRAKTGEKKLAKSWNYGWQEGQILGKIEPGEGQGEEGWEGAKVFVVPSTSGLVTIPQDVQKGVWNELGAWVNERRNVRGIKVPQPQPQLQQSVSIESATVAVENVAIAV